ncbi:enzymatic poly [Lasius niger]|uniref:Enzymatic poly n=1 Tax=Lasius niger TaxID=67767 RepID=A0A0J7JZB1_LASNI|nr:enzymatic poly [Lasius niger]
MDQIIKDEDLKGTFPYLDDVTIGGKNQKEHDRNLKKFLDTAEKYNLTLNKDKCQFSVTLLGYVISNKTIKPDSNRLKPLLELPIPKDAASLRRTLGMFSHYRRWILRFSEIVRPLLEKNQFPLSDKATSVFKTLKNDVARATMAAIRNNVPFRGKPMFLTW